MIHFDDRKTRHNTNQEEVGMAVKKGSNLQSNKGGKNKNTNKTIEDVIAEDRKERKLKSEDHTWKKRYVNALKQIDLLEEEKSIILEMKDKTIKPSPIIATKGITSEATAVVLASDWHAGKRVISERVNGLNSFNVGIFKKRADNFFINTTRLLNIFDKDITIKNLVLALLGDFIENTLRLENHENNTMLPIEEVLLVQEYFIKGIEYLLSNTTKTLIIPCVTGNHSKNTDKMHISTQVENSLEYFIYANLQQYFKNNNRVKFIIAEGQMLYLDVYGFKIRFTHGSQIHSAGGIGGIFPPTYRALSGWDKGQKADLTCMGHIHNTKFGGNFLYTGSLCGYDEFALSIKADFERPQQTFFLIDKNRGLTITAPVLLDNN